jgi:hypothetical protein
MAQTKIKLIADGVIDVNNLKAGHTITTDNIGEGTNLYYTDARVGSYLSTNSYATEGYVTTAVSNLVDAAPSTLDTLNELAAALGDDPNFATTVTNSIATKLPLAGGTISGNLTVSGSLTGTLATAAQPNITSVGTLTGLTVSGNLTVDTNTLFVDAANNNVGIGTSSPASLLEINGGGTVTTGGTLIVRQKGDADGDGISLTSSNGTSHRIWKDASGNLNIGPSNSTSALVQTLSGNVGIGTSSPAQTLHLYKSDTFSRMLLENGTSNSYAIYVAKTGNSSDWQWGVWSNNSYRVGAAGVGDFMTITSGGNVGVGTTSPAAKLHIASGNIKLDNGYGIDFSASAGAGATSSLLDDYEEGTWTPTVGGTWTTNPTTLSGYYTKIGNMVYIRLQFFGGVKSSTISGWIDGLPFSGAVGGGGTVSDVNVADKGIVLLDNGTRVWFAGTNNFGAVLNKVMAFYQL